MTQKGTLSPARDRQSNQFSIQYTRSLTHASTTPGTLALYYYACIAIHTVEMCPVYTGSHAIVIRLTANLPKIGLLDLSTTEHWTFSEYITSQQMEIDITCIILGPLAATFTLKTLIPIPAI